MMLRVMCQRFCATRSGPTYSNFWSGKSAEVTTALTPGNASAFDASIERIRAWACGERMTLPWSVPAVAKSAPYIARPVTFGTPSGRIGRVPTHLNPFAAMSFIAVSVVALCWLNSDYRGAVPAQKQNRQSIGTPRMNVIAKSTRPEVRYAVAGQAAARSDGVTKYMRQGVR